MNCQTAIYSEDYADFLFDFVPDDSLFNNQENCRIIIENNLSLFYQKQNNALSMPLSQYRYLYLPTLYTLSSFEVTDTVLSFYSVLERSGISPVLQPPLSLSGLGVQIGIIDNGIDFTDPAFRNPDGTSRIIALWDQSNTTGNPPERFPYGRLYSKEELDTALLDNTPLEKIPVKDTPFRHGTPLATIMAGSKTNRQPTGGVAPLASLIVVKLKPAKQYLQDYYAISTNVTCYEENDIITALSFINSFRQTFLSPVTIFIGVGTNYGNHNGNSLLEQYIHRLSALPNLAIICAGGDEGNSSHHYRGIFTDSSQPQTVELLVSEDNLGFMLQFYGSLTNRFSLQLRSPLGENITDISFDLQRSITYRSLYDNTSITVDSLLSEPLSGEESIYLRFLRPTPGIWQITVSGNQISPNAYYDFWLPENKLLNTPVYFLSPDPYITLSAPSMALNGICVSGYPCTQGLLSPSSGRGYLKNGFYKPDLAACSVSTNLLPENPGGSIVSAALVCGASALLFEWAVLKQRFPLLNGLQVRNLFRQGANRPINETFPNREHGYGYLNLANSIASLE